MRKRQVRNGLCFMLASLCLIILASFYHREVARLLFFSANSGQMLYSQGIFWAAAIGGYGVVATVLGFALSSDRRDKGVKLFPVIFMLLCAVALFFYLFFSSFQSSVDEPEQSPETSISI